MQDPNLFAHVGIDFVDADGVRVTSVSLCRRLPRVESIAMAEQWSNP
jgi:hypothetical protein